jgi:hypothetical protein
VNASNALVGFTAQRGRFILSLAKTVLSALQVRDIRKLVKLDIIAQHKLIRKKIVQEPLYALNPILTYIKNAKTVLIALRDQSRRHSVQLAPSGQATLET